MVGNWKFLVELGNFSEMAEKRNFNSNAVFSLMIPLLDLLLLNFSPLVFVSDVSLNDLTVILSARNNVISE